MGLQYNIDKEVKHQIKTIHFNSYTESVKVPIADWQNLGKYDGVSRGVKQLLRIL